MKSTIKKPFGIDVSRYQGKIDWDAVASHKEPVRFAGIRATISWGYVDSWFQRNWAEAKRIGIFRMAYHVLYPETLPERQIDFFLQTVGNDMGELPLVIDVELDHGQSTQKVENTLFKCCELITKKTGRNPVIYSRANWIDKYLIGNRYPPAWMNEYDWWLAHYPKYGGEHQGPPPLPKGVVRERCIIHQTTDRGAPIGTESKQMDWNRWQYSKAHFEDYANLKIPLTIKEKLSLLWKAHPELHEQN